MLDATEGPYLPFDPSTSFCAFVALLLATFPLYQIPLSQDPFRRAPSPRASVSSAPRACFREPTHGRVLLGRRLAAVVKESHYLGVAAVRGRHHGRLPGAVEGVLQGSRRQKHRHRLRVPVPFFVCANAEIYRAPYHKRSTAQKAQEARVNKDLFATTH
jgi:hypothetical protein